jgi:hypothetical protein
MNIARNLVVAATLLAARPAGAQVTGPAGYVYDARLLGTTTQSCVAAGAGGTFVSLGPGFTANGQVVVLAKESGATGLVAFGFNSIGDCAYDAARDVLYVSDNAGELPGALTGDTVFAIPAASSAPGLAAPDLELVAAGSVPTAAGVALAADGAVLVSDAAGGGAGTVGRIALAAPPMLATFAAGFDFTGGVAVDPSTGDVFVADTRAVTFDARIRQFAAGGAERPLFAGPSFDFGSFDLAYDATGRLLATGLFGGDVVAFDNMGAATPFVTGLAFASGITTNEFTGRVEILSSFSGTDADRSVHRFVPADRLFPGGGRAATECLHEFYGLAAGATPRQSACTDGAPCDADNTVNDRCLLPVGFCLVPPATGPSDCTAGGPIVGATITTNPFDVAVATAATRLAARLPVSTPACVFSDGVVVAIKSTSRGKKSGVTVLRVSVTSAGGAEDVDRIRLVCNPSA